MQDLNTIPSVGTFGEVARNANTNFSLLKIAVDLLEHSIEHSRGYFTSASALTTAFPSPAVGDWAIVEVSGSPVIYKCSTRGTWSNSGTQWAGGSVDLTEYLKKGTGDVEPSENSDNWITSKAVSAAIKTIIGQETNYVSGKYLNANGVVSSDSAWCYYKVHIPVQQGDTIKYYPGAYKAGRYLVVFNEEGTREHYLESRESVRTLSVTSEAASYVMFSFAKTATETAYVDINGKKYYPVDAYEGIVQNIRKEIGRCDAKIDDENESLRNEIGLPDIANYYDLFERGSIAINSSGWTYAEHATRLRTKEGLTLHLKAGDVIGLKTYVSGQTFYVGYRKKDGTYGTPGAWQTRNYTCPVDGDYVLCWNNNSKAIEEMSDYFFIKSDNTIEEIRKINTGRGRGEHEYYGKPIDLACRQSNRCLSFTSLEHYFEGEGKITMWNQSMAIYSGHFFVFLDATARTTSDVNCDIVVIYQSEIIFTGLLPAEVASHVNNAQFTNTFFASGDKYPLLLLSRGDYGGNKANKCYLLRITETTEEDTTTYEFTIVKTITLSGVPEVNYNGSWVCDFVNNKLFLYTMATGYWNVTTNNWFVIFEFPLPDFSASGDIAISAADVVKRMDFDYMVFQGAASAAGKLFIGVQNFTRINGYTPKYYKAHAVAVINPSSGEIETLIPTDDMENEGVCIYNGLLYVSSKNGSATSSTTSACFNIKRYKF